MNFRGVASANALMTVTLDAGNNAILLTVDSAAIAAALPAATTTQAGVLETATNAEAIAKAATDKIVTPSNFAAMAASTTFSGFAETATQAEVNAGVDALRYVAPDTLGVLLGTKKNTTTFADAVARAAAVPAFVGQIGTQLDTDQPYVASGAGAGAWDALMVFNSTATVANGTTNGLQLGTSTLDISDGTISFVATTISGDSMTISFTNNTTINVQGSTFNMDAAVFQIGGSSMGANSVLCTSGTPGDLTDFALSTFVSNANVDSGWTVTNLGALRALDCSAASLGDVRNILGTLITALLGTLKPSA